MKNLIDTYKTTFIDDKDYALLYDDEKHKIYWIGIQEDSAFRCNVYLIEDDGEFLIVDPGSKLYHEDLKNNIRKITDIENIKGLILCHQDPDVASSITNWIEINPDIKIITSSRTNVLLPYYRCKDYNFYDISENQQYKFQSGNVLKFIEAPFLHFPGAFTTLDLKAKMLFSGDVFAAIDVDWNLVVNDFEEHINNMNLFHIDYMASNIAARGFARKIEKEIIEAILPQHGSIIGQENISNAIKYLKNLKCGLDIIYADLK